MFELGRVTKGVSNLAGLVVLGAVGLVGYYIWKAKWHCRLPGAEDVFGDCQRPLIERCKDPAWLLFHFDQRDACDKETARLKSGCSDTSWVSGHCSEATDLCKFVDMPLTTPCTGGSEPIPSPSPTPPKNYGVCAIQVGQEQLRYPKTSLAQTCPDVFLDACVRDRTSYACHMTWPAAARTVCGSWGEAGVGPVEKWVYNYQYNCDGSPVSDPGLPTDVTGRCELKYTDLPVQLRQRVDENCLGTFARACAAGHTVACGITPTSVTKCSSAGDLESYVKNTGEGAHDCQGVVLSGCGPVEQVGLNQCQQEFNGAVYSWPKRSDDSDCVTALYRKLCDDPGSLDVLVHSGCVNRASYLAWVRTYRQGRCGGTQTFL